MSGSFNDGIILGSVSCRVGGNRVFIVINPSKANGDIALGRVIHLLAPSDNGILIGKDGVYRTSNVRLRELERGFNCLFRNNTLLT